MSVDGWLTPNVAVTPLGGAEVSELELEPQRGIGTAEVSILVRGEVDMATSSQLRDALDAAIEAGATTIVLECQGLGFLDSSGIGVLVAARDRLGDDGALVLDSPPGNVRKVLDITGVAGLLTVR